MPRRGENIFKRQDGRWEARYIHHYENGKAKYRYLYGTTYGEVKQKRLAEQVQVIPEKSPGPRRGGDIGRLACEWLRDVKISVKESTYARYCMIVNNYIIPHLGAVPLSKLDPQAVNLFSEKLLKNGGSGGHPLSSKSVCDILCVLKSVHRFGKCNGFGAQSLDGLRYPQRSGRQIEIFSANDGVLLETALLRSEDATSLGILFALFTGVRIGELCGLKWEDIDFSDCTVRICRTVERISDTDPLAERKTKLIVSEPKTHSSARVIPLPKFLPEHLLKYRGPDNTYLLTGNTDFVEPHCFYTRYKSFLRKHHIGDHTFHSLRHTFATRCVEHGFDTKSLSEILGHSNVTTTLMFYVHPSLVQKRKQMELLTPTMQT